MATKLAVIVADFTTTLATKIAVGGTTATLQSATDDDGVALPSGEYAFTLNGDNAQKEHIICTLSGTSLSAIKSVTRQGVQSSGTVREHRVGSSVKITNFTHIKYINDLLDGTTNLDADTPLKYDGTATIGSANQIATKAYVDGVAIAGGADASTTVKGISKMSVAPVSATEPIAVGDNDNRVPTVDTSSVTSGMVDALAGSAGTPSSSNTFVTEDDTATASTANAVVRADGSGKIADDWLSSKILSTISLNAGETISGATLPVPVYQDTSDNEVYACDANDLNTLRFIGFATTDSTDGNPITVQVSNIVAGFTGLSEGEYYYVQDAVGTIGTTVGTEAVLVGVAVSETQLLVASTNDMASSKYVTIPFDGNIVDEANTTDSVSGSTYTKYKEIQYNEVAGTVHTTFQMRDSSGGANSRDGRIYINGVAVGTERTTTSGTFQTYTEDISVETGDLVQLYSRTNGTGGGEVRNFQLGYIKIPSITPGTVNDS